MAEIYYNGSIITMEEQEEAKARSNAPEAILVEHGIITKTGTLKDCEDKNSKAKKVDLQGCCLMPSFIDSHGHVVMNGQMSICAYLGDCESFEDIIQVLKAYIKENKLTSQDVVMGFGYDQNFLKEQAQPDKRVLDKVSQEIPIILLHASAHFMCVNSAALVLAGVEEETMEPQGGHIERMEGSREPSGYMEENAMTPFSKIMGERMQKKMPEIMANMQDNYLKNGVTTVQDGASTEGELAVLKAMNAQSRLKVDVISYPMLPQGGDKLMEREKQALSGRNSHLRLGGYKLVLDGSPQGRSAWMSKPYEGEEEYSGYPWMKDEEVEKYIRQAMLEEQQLLVHCNGDAAGEQFLKVYEKVKKELACSKELRPVMIHCQTIRSDQIERMAKLHMIASVFVGHVWYWGEVHLKNLGTERGMRISPARELIDKGVCVTFHQDTPVTPPDMLHTVWTAVNRLSKSGRVIGAQQRISVYEALQTVTIHAAYQYFEENTKGSIREGKRADLVILDKSPLETAKEEIKDIRVMQTIKDGEIVYRAKENSVDKRL